MASEDKGNGCLGGFIMATLSVSMLVLFVVLGNECGAVGDALEAYRARIHAGEAVSVEVGGEEAAALTQAFLAAERVRVANFITQSGTECVDARLVGPSGSVAVDVLLDTTGEPHVVLGVTITGDCHCPIDEDQPCRMR